MGIQDNPHYALLKTNEGQIFRVGFADGEVVIAKVLHVDDWYGDFIFDAIAVVSAVKLGRYTLDGSACYTAKLAELVSATIEEQHAQP